MRDRMFGRVIGVGLIVALLFVGRGLYRNSQMPPAAFPSAAYGAEEAPEETQLVFTPVRTERKGFAGFRSIIRAKVPGGWLLMVQHVSNSDAFAIAFYPDPRHEWRGGSLK